MGYFRMIPGISLDLSGETFIVPPLSLGSIEIYEDDLDSIQSFKPKDQRRLIVNVALAALNRNYPDLTREKLVGLLDLDNMNEVLSATMDVAGLKRKEIEAGSGEALGASA